MKYRKLGKTNFEVSEIGYGAWGIGGNQLLRGADDESLPAPPPALQLGLHLIDSPPPYGDGPHERLLGPGVPPPPLRPRPQPHRPPPPLGRRPQRGARRAGRPRPPPEDLRRHQSPAEESHLARPARHADLRGLPIRLHHGQRGREPQQPEAPR